jgi:nucleoside phosphorylase/CheY-like chemotaxis protein
VHAPTAPSVLIIDDEYFTTSRYAEALSAVGFTVRIAASVLEAIKALESAQFDLVVLDVMMMPEGVFEERKVAGGFKTGIALFELIEQRWPNTNVVVLTSDDDPSTKRWFEVREILFIYKNVELRFDFARRMRERIQSLTSTSKGLESSAAPSSNDEKSKLGEPHIARPRIIRLARRRPISSSDVGSPDVLILTAADIEYDTVIDLAGVRSTLKARRRVAGARTFIDLGFPGIAVWAFQCRKGSVGPGSSLDVLKDALNVLDPKPLAVINTGIAFGLKPEKQKMGDILVAEQVRLYELERRGPTRIARGDKVSCSSLLFSWFRDFRADWALAGRRALRPSVRCGLIMSGEKLADDEEFVSELLRIEPEAIGGEMEAAGVYAAAAGEHFQHVHWTVVKGICDWGLGKGDSYQAVAARNAIDFVFHVLGQPAVAESIRNLRG